MAYEFIKLEKSDRIATLTLNRPEKMNALSTGLLTEFSDALDDVHNDHDVNVLILTGAGRAFSAGYDISPGQEAPDIPATAAWDAKHLPARTLMKLWHLRQPTIAAVNGHALAAGNVLAMTADIVIAAEHATFGEPEIRFVAHSPAIMLPYMIPLRHLHWLYYTGDTVDAHTAEKWNMVNWVVPAAELMDTAKRWASEILLCAPISVRASKEAAYKGLDLPLPAALTHSFHQQRIMGQSEDLIEGPRAFAEKRTPNWKGR